MRFVRVVLSFDEMKPHWAINQGLDKKAEALGMTNIVVSGDFDAKIARIYGDVDDFTKFERAVQAHPQLSEGSLAKAAR